MNDIAGSVKGYLKKKQEQRSFTGEVVEVRWRACSCQLALPPPYQRV